MEDDYFTEAEMEGKMDVVRLASKLSYLLHMKMRFTDEEIEILTRLSAQLNQMEDPVVDDSDEARFLAAKRKIESWKLDSSMIWDSNPAQALEYLRAVEYIHKVIEKLESHGFNICDEQAEKLETAYSLRQDAMERLEDELKHILSRNRQERASSSSPVDDMDIRSLMSPGNRSLESSDRKDNGMRFSEELSINQMVISDLKSIVDLMFASGYSLECCNAYVDVRKAVSEEFLVELNFEKLTIDDALKLDVKNLLNPAMARWINVMKTVVAVHLLRENQLGEVLFSGHGDAHLICFCEASKSSMSHLLNFGEAMTIGPHDPGKINTMVFIHGVLADLLPLIDSLFMKETGSYIRNRYHNLLNSMSGSIASAFEEFFRYLRKMNTTLPVPLGDIHPCSRYTMNYLLVFLDDQATLDVVLKNVSSKEDSSSSASSSSSSSPMASHFLRLVSALVRMLQETSKSYKDSPLRHIFLVNNLHYIVNKIQNKELHPLFGDEWLRRHTRMFFNEIMEYQRSTWYPVQLILKVEEEPSSAVLKNKFQRFAAAFDEIYSLHTTWVIQDDNLRERVRVESLNFYMAYQAFYLKNEKKIPERYIKYTAEDIENRLQDFFKSG